MPTVPVHSAKGVPVGARTLIHATGKTRPAPSGMPTRYSGCQKMLDKGRCKFRTKAGEKYCANHQPEVESA